MTNQKQKMPNKTWYNGGCCSRDHVSYIDNSENRITFLYGVTSSETNLDNEQKDCMILEGSNGETIHYLRAWDGEESSIMWVN